MPAHCRGDSGVLGRLVWFGAGKEQARRGGAACLAESVAVLAAAGARNTVDGGGVGCRRGCGCM